MKTKAAKAGENTAAESPVTRYVSALKAAYGRYARPADETRRIVDEAMAGSPLTGLLYEARDEA